MKRKVLLTISVLLVIGIGVVFMYKSEVERAATLSTFFTGGEQYENFNRMVEFFPYSTLTASPIPHQITENFGATLPESFIYNGRAIDSEQFLAETDTSALLVMKDGQLVFEQYMLTGGRNVNWLSMSVAKSFTSVGVGIAVDQGLIDIHKPITDYVPELLGSAYDGVSVKNVLQMSSGAAWDEDYNNPDSDVNRLGRLMALGGSADEFVASLQREYEPGTYNRYNSADTQALGMLLARATGRSVTDYLEEYLWHPLGMESDGYWLIDSRGVELAFFGLNVTARDYAKVGELYRQNGLWGDKQIVSESWVKQSTTPDAPHLLPGVHEEFPLGYGYQWWIPESEEGEYLAIGVYNQFIYVNPHLNLVIVKLSAFSDYASSKDESAYREIETIEFFRAIGRSLQ